MTAYGRLKLPKLRMLACASRDRPSSAAGDVTAAPMLQPLPLRRTPWHAGKDEKFRTLRVLTVTVSRTPGAGSVRFM
jgi:hypothetical protein